MGRCNKVMDKEMICVVFHTENLILKESVPLAGPKRTNTIHMFCNDGLFEPEVSSHQTLTITCSGTGVFKKYVQLTVLGACG